MKTTDRLAIAFSQGIEIGRFGFIAGGGGRGLTPALDDAVTDAAEALSALYGDAPVTVRFNSDRLSGGAWLETAEVDYIGGNAEVGITAVISPDAMGSAPTLRTYLKRIALAEGDWEDNYRDPIYVEHDSVEAAIAYITDTALLDFEGIRGRIATLVEKKRAGLLD